MTDLPTGSCSARLHSHSHPHPVIGTYCDRRVEKGVLLPGEKYVAFSHRYAGIATDRPYFGCTNCYAYGDGGNFCSNCQSDVRDMGITYERRIMTQAQFNEMRRPSSRQIEWADTDIDTDDTEDDDDDDVIANISNAIDNLAHLPYEEIRLPFYIIARR